MIIGSLDLVHAGDGETAELVREAIDAALHGAQLTRSLLAYARRQPLQPDRIDPNSLAHRMVGLLRRTLGEDIPITLNLASDLWMIEVDPAQLEACIVNLATNARDAMPRGGNIIVATKNVQADATYLESHPYVTPGDYAVMEVTDTGSGMTPEIQKQVFEPFFTKEVGKGTGLGLSMVFGFIKQSGGFVTIYSELGVGTTVRLHLPRADGAEANEPAIAVPAARTAEGKSVLVVEDNDALRRVVVRQLSMLGYRVRAAESAAAALAIVARERIDLLFSDVVMPGEIDGISLAREVLLSHPEISVVLTSGFPEKRFEDRYDGLPPAVRLLGKPISQR